MAAPVTQSFPEQLRQPGVVQNVFNTSPRPAGKVTVHINSAEWRATDPGDQSTFKTITYRAQKSYDNKATWVEAAGFTATSPTYMKDGVTQIEPGLVEDWDGTETNYRVQVTTTQAFSWGAQFTLADNP